MPIACAKWSVYQGVRDDLIDCGITSGFCCAASNKSGVGRRRTLPVR